MLAINSGVNGVSINPAASTILVGNTAAATASISVVTGISNALKFTSSDTTITTVTNVGNVATIVAVGGVSIAPAVVVTVKDALGATAVGAVNNVTLAIGANPSNGTLGGTVTVAAVAVAGVATFPAVNINKIGNGYTLTASAAAMVTATSTTFNILVGPPTQIAVLVQPVTTFVLTNIMPALQFAIEDAGGNLVAGAVNPVTVALLANPGGSTLTGGLVHAAAGGIATFGDLQLNFGASGYTITATSPGLTSAVTTAFNVTGPFTQLSSAGATTCGLMAATTYCWGDNSAGQLGNNSNTNSNIPTAVSGGLVWASVSVGGDGRTCGITTAQKAYCWGNNSVGQIGDNTTTNRKVPTLVSGGITWATISAGSGSQTCGSSTGNTTYCWDSNTQGLLGAGIGIPASWPVPLTVGSFSKVSAGGSSNCAVGAGGAVSCWGANDSGELGNNSNIFSNVPVAVSGGLTFSSVSVTSPRRAASRRLGPCTAGATTEAANSATATSSRARCRCGFPPRPDPRFHSAAESEQRH